MKCKHMELGDVEPMGDGIIRHPAVRCDEDADIIILFAEPDYSKGETEYVLTQTPVCDGHALEEIHELKQCCETEEFLIIRITNKGIKVLEGGYTS